MLEWLNYIMLHHSEIAGLIDSYQHIIWHWEIHIVYTKSVKVNYFQYYSGNFSLNTVTIFKDWSAGQNFWRYYSNWWLIEDSICSNDAQRILRKGDIQRRWSRLCSCAGCSNSSGLSLQGCTFEAWRNCYLWCYASFSWS